MSGLEHSSVNRAPALARPEGEGWRAVSARDHGKVTGARRVEYDENGELVGIWVREEPVPPLPTEQDTLIQVTWRQGTRGGLHHDGRLVLDDGSWADRFGRTAAPSEVAERITGFEVLAGPLMQDEITWEQTKGLVRRETAKAVLDRVAAYWNQTTPAERVGLQVIAREFGVDS